MINRQLPITLSRQKGVVLFVAVVALIVMALAAITLMRSTDTGETIAGNMAFKEAATHAADTGVELAFEALPTIIQTPDTATSKYFPTLQEVDANGVPKTITWDNVPCYVNGVVVTDCTNQSTYRVQYVIDRQCTVSPVTDVTAQCINTSLESSSSKKAGASNFNAASQISYRVTVRVRGPRNTTSLVQALLAF